MKTLQTLIVSALFLFGGMAAQADNSNNLIYNSEEVNGVVVGETIYKAEGTTLTNYMKYAYTYDAQGRKIQSEAQKWNTAAGEWVNDLCIRYTYKGKSIVTEYYKWNKKQKEYILAPEMTVTMDNPNM